MTATTRVSDFKGKRGYISPDGRPKAGTKLRGLYDSLRLGGVVNASCVIGRGSSGYLMQLRDFYGMDIERVARTDGKRGGWAGVRLLGEWEGPYYVPIERIVAGMAGEA